jgi:chromosome segregation protein
LYLKRLELYGFKTFADRTSLEFGPGVIGIVGPNGSGKSNLADAILWSLGEQSMKSLRSNRSGDVIFAGSESKRRLGVGEVSLTLDNSDGALPLDFSEVTITRRVFRTGEGEYFINRVPCRLRDIHELFLDTGLGKNAYSMMGQNEIDRILSVRSEDRREIFEQAAGIQRYRQRKNEAGRKLERVYANLTRVNDIIHELEGQLAPLAQQSETARQYKELAKELFDLKLSLMVHQRRAMLENRESARERQAELDRETEQAKTRSHQLAAAEVQLRAKLQELEGRLEETRNLVGRIASECDRAEGKRNLAQQKIEDLKAQQSRAREELAQLEAQRQAAEGELATAEGELPKLEARRNEVCAEIEARDLHLREATGSLRETGTSVQELRSEHLEMLRELADTRNRLGQAESLLAAARARIERLTEQIGAIREQREQLAAEASEAGRAAQEMRAARDRQAGEMAALRLEEQAAEAAAPGLVEEQLQVREQLSAVRSRARALEEMERAREGLRGGVRAVLAAAQSGRLRGEYRTIAELVQAPKELEAAIEAALGPAVGDLVVDTPEEAAAAIAFLKEAKAGRATFMPRATMRVGSRPSGLSELASRPGCRGAAADLIECQGGAEGIVEHLLGRVLVVETLDGALEIARDSTGWRSIVTLDGDVVRPWGAITGGSRPQRVGLIGRAREIAELQEEAAKLESEQARISGGLERTQARAAEARGKAEARLAEVEQSGLEVTAAERRSEVAAEKVRLAVEREESLLAEQQSLEREAKQIGEEAAEAGAAVAALEAHKAAAESAMSERESALSAGRDEKEELNARASELRVEVAALDGDIRALGARIEKIRDSARMLGKAAEDRRRLVDRLASEEQEAVQGCQERGTEWERLREALQKAEQELARCQEERKQLLDGLAANREEAAANRAELEALQNRSHRLELRRTQIESEIAFCERTLAEEYRISLKEAEQRAQPIESRTAAQQRAKELQGSIEAMGDVNVGSIEEYERVKQRLEFLGGQRADLEAAREDLQQAITEIDGEATARFLAAFDHIQREFQTFFIRLFGGGRAELSLSDKDNVLESGIDVTVTVPGKKTRDLLQLSGGERALTAAAILFALLKVKPSPFVILDEVDAPLDDSNIGRYSNLLREFARQSQFIVITHNKGTMEAADVLYGVTMEEAGASKLIGMRLRDPEESRRQGEPRPEPAAAGDMEEPGAEQAEEAA